MEIKKMRIVYASHKASNCFQSNYYHSTYQAINFPINSNYINCHIREEGIKISKKRINSHFISATEMNFSYLKSPAFYFKRMKNSL